VSAVITEAERMALDFLSRVDSDQVGIIDTEEKFAAAVIYMHLHDKGLVVATRQPEGGPRYYITKAGREALSA